MEFVSDGCRKLTGYEPDDLLFNNRISYESITHPDDRARVREVARRGRGECGRRRHCDRARPGDRGTGPGRGVGPVRQAGAEQVHQRRRQVRGVRRPADLVVDDRQLVAPGPRSQFGAARQGVGRASRTVSSDGCEVTRSSGT